MDGREALVLVPSGCPSVHLSTYRSDHHAFVVCGLNLWSDSPRRLCAAEAEAEAEAAGGKCGLCGPWQ